MAEFGVIGLGTMGSNLALNLDDHGVGVAVWNLEPERTKDFLSGHPDRAFTGSSTFEELVTAIERPRRLLMMIPAGDPVDQTIDRLVPLLDPGDVLIDGGNSNFHNTERRFAALEPEGIAFFGVGVSGGSSGARHGPSMMPGGPEEHYATIAPVLEAIAARTDAGPCVGYLGRGGAGHFVKMVHNGIEYADMQSIAEAYDVLRRGLGLAADAIADLFETWNEGPLGSYLMEISGRILRVRDAGTGGPLVDEIVDEASQKGTGRWTAITALELGVPVPSIAAAVDARVVSSRRDERAAAERALSGPAARIASETLADDVRDAVYASRICAFAQGMDLIAAGAEAYDWGIPRAEVARVWMDGCIIRARLLEPIRSALLEAPGIDNLLLDEALGREIVAAQAGWRRALEAATGAGIPTPVWSTSRSYFDGYRTARLPQNLTQAQRDYFGAHAYRRLDDPEGGPRHTDWSALTAETRR